MRLSHKKQLSFLLLGLLLAGCGSPEQREAQYIKKGTAFLDAGEFEKARIEFKNASRIRPNDAEPLYRMGLVDEAEGSLPAARSDYEQAEQQNSHYAPALLKLAEFNLAGQQFDEAEKRIQSVLKAQPDNAEAHALQAGYLITQKDFTGAESEGQTALQKDPTSATAYGVLAGLYTKQGDNAKADSMLDAGIAKNPQSLALLQLKASLNDQAGNLDKVKEAFGQIFKLKPDEPRYRSQLAMIYLKAGQPDDAEAALRDGIAALPNDWELKHDLIQFLADHRSVDTAENEINHLMQLYPNDQRLDRWLTDLYVQHDAVDRAIAFLNKVIEQNPSNGRGTNARLAMARIKLAQGDKEAARKLDKDALAVDGGNLDAIFIRADLAFDDGFYQSAIDDIHSILRQRPKDKDTLYLLSEVLAAQGHNDLAIDTLNQIVTLDPLNVFVRVRLAQMYQINGDPKHAMDILFLVTHTTPQYPYAWENVARVAMELKDWTTADRAIGVLDGFKDQHQTATFLRATLLALSDKKEEAAQNYTGVINDNPNSPLATMALQALQRVDKDLNKLEDLVTYIGSFKKPTAMSDTILGESYLALGKKDQAEAAFDAAIALNASDSPPYLYKAKILLDAKKPDEAVKVLEKAFAANPKDTRLPMMEAQILQDQGQYEQAIAIYDDLLLRNSSFDAAANNLAELIADYDYNDPKKLERARQVADRFAASSNPLVLDTLAWVYYRQDNLPQAQILVQRILSSSVSLPPEVLYHCGAILLKAGKTKEAEARLQQALADNSVYPGRDDAQKLLTSISR